jgi:glycosyltransferase involved in cell wall biosynthesis
MLRSFLDEADRHRVAGWAQDDDQPGAPLTLLILVGDALAARVLANRYRPDLAAAGIGDGRHGFRFEFPQSLSPHERHVVRVCREADGADLTGSPAMLDPVKTGDGMAYEHLAEIDIAGLSDTALARGIELMAEHADQAVQEFAHRQSGGIERREYRLRVERWRRRGAVGEMPTESGPQRRALIIDDRVPQPRRDAGSNVILSHARSLQRLGFAVSFAAALDIAASENERAALDADGIAWCGMPYYRSVEEVLRRQAGEFDLIYLHRIANAAKYGELARQHFPKARQIYGVADLHHLRVARQAKAEDRPELAPLANRLRLMEFTAAALADAVITHSSDEARLLEAQLGNAKVHIARWSAAPRPTKTAFGKRRGIAFIGGYGHPPNLDAARWLIAEIMPRVREQDPAIECLLVGDGLPEGLKQRCGYGVVALGAVADLTEIFERVRLTVAPLRFGAGIKGKIVDSLAAGVPCVTTLVGAEGFDLPLAFGCGIAATAEAIAATVLRLHGDAAASETCRAAGLRYIEEAFSEQNLDAAMARAAGVPIAQRPPEAQQQRQAARTVRHARHARHATLSEAS